MPECSEYKKAKNVSSQSIVRIELKFFVLKSPNVAVSGGKKIKACGRPYFIADTTVAKSKRRRTIVSNCKIFSGNSPRCCNILLFNEHDRFVSGIFIRTILFAQNVPNR
jgi:hypothetical protein